ncbi:hypothetical protein DRO69_09445 [Candidatus Bathyarchaeota archaeon]|nr:MAG: hypothetical protein DRO69_09445 [Candidatus Bathyarchaeota archaeon]
MSPDEIDLIIKNLKKIRPYTQGESISDISTRTGLSTSKIVKLNANENLFVPMDFTLKIAKRAAEEVDHRMYPSGLENEVYEKLSDYLKIDKNNILIGFGSDQLIDLLIVLFGKKGVTTIHPTYTYYRARCELYGVPYRFTLFDKNLNINMNELKNCLRKSSMFILCSPNNPTGHVISENIIEDIAEEFNGIIVLDEIYAEFSDTQFHKLPLEMKNVVVIRSFSKAFGAAGIRLGYLVASKKLMEILRKCQQPYPVTGFSLKYASLLLDEVDYFKELWKQIKETRKWFYEELKKFKNIHVFPSQTNFVSFGSFIDGMKLYEEFAKKGYLIRVFSNVMGFKTLTRVTIAPKNILEGFIRDFSELMKNAI